MIDAHSSHTFSRPKNPTPSGVCVRADHIVAKASINNVFVLSREEKKCTSKSVLRRYPQVERNSSCIPGGDRKQDDQEMNRAHCGFFDAGEWGMQADTLRRDKSFLKNRVKAILAEESL